MKDEDGYFYVNDEGKKFRDDEDFYDDDNQKEEEE